MTSGGDVDEIGGDSRGGRQCTGAAPLEHHPADKISLGDDGVVDALYGRDRCRARHHARVDALLDPPLCQARDPEKLDAVAELFGKVDVEPRYVTNALGVDPFEIDRTAKTDAGQNGELVRRVDAVDVKARVCFGITKLLRFGEHLGEFVRAL